MMQQTTLCGLRELYPSDTGKAAERIDDLKKRFTGRFAAAPEDFFSSPGRTEIIGNHTDHNGGRVLASSIDRDMICAVSRVNGNTVTIVSEGHEDVTLDITALPSPGSCHGTKALVAGVISGLLKEGYRIEAFNAYVTSDVPVGGGLSSSASYEMLLCALINHLFNDGAIPVETCARIGGYAENTYWNKSSGLLDQMACAAGGMIVLNFRDDIRYGQVPFSFEDIGCDLIFINTGTSHKDLAGAYSAVSDEMRMVARALGAETLAETTRGALLEALPALRTKLKNDRALLRAIHFFDECERVDAAVRLIVSGKKEALPALMRLSSDSSWELLQNMYLPEDPVSQGLPLILTLAKLCAGMDVRTACRIHGGGFGGVIQCIIPKENTAAFMASMSPVAGKDNIFTARLRQHGAVRIQVS